MGTQDIMNLRLSRTSQALSTCSQKITITSGFVARPTVPPPQMDSDPDPLLPAFEGSSKEHLRCKGTTAIVQPPYPTHQD